MRLYVIERPCAAHIEQGEFVFGATFPRRKVSYAYRHFKAGGELRKAVFKNTALRKRLPLFGRKAGYVVAATVKFGKERDIGAARLCNFAVFFALAHSRLQVAGGGNL